MIKKISIIAMLFITSIVSAQFYISASGGYSFPVGEKVLGKKDITTINKGITTTTKGEIKGSYGEGIQSQLRFGYFFTEKIGAELGVGYLHGTNQAITERFPPNVNVKGRARAFGASLTGIYNITDNFYVRAGLLTKIAGKTEIIGNVKDNIEKGKIPTIPDTQVNIDFTTDFKGEFPLGFIGAIGYKHKITDNWSIFGEVEYMNINVTRKKSELKSFSATATNVLGTKNLTNKELIGLLTSSDDLKTQFKNLIPLIQDETTWGKDGLEAPDAPYSSLGFNIGFTYTFSK